MSHSVSSDNLIQAVRDRGEYDPHFIDKPEMIGFINAGIAAFHDLLAHFAPERVTTSDNISVVKDTQAYDLPNDYYRTVEVAVPSTWGNGDHVSLLHVNTRQRRYNQQSLWPYPTNVAKENTEYQIQGAKIWFWPTPKWTDTVVLTYIYTPELVTIDTPITIEAYNDFTEFVILYALEQCDLKGQDGRSAQWLRLRMEIMDRIKHMARPESSQPFYMDPPVRRRGRRLYRRSRY